MKVSTTTQMPLSSWPFKNLWGKKIRMYGLDIVHIQFTKASKGKLLDIKTWIQNISKHKTTINDVLMWGVIQTKAYDESNECR